MEPLKPSERAKLLTRGTEAELNEYEGLLVNRFYEYPGYKRTPEEEQAYQNDEKRLKELAKKFYPEIFDKKPADTIDECVE